MGNGNLKTVFPPNNQNTAVLKVHAQMGGTLVCSELVACAIFNLQIAAAENDLLVK